MTKRQALGRGLAALIPENKPETKDGGGELISEIPVEKISSSRYQPRTVFKKEALIGLANSIKERGVIQPIIVTKKREGFELIAGERRWRAVKSLGLKTIPAIVKVVRDSEALEMAIIENIQRENLNPIEEANSYTRLMNEFALTQEGLSKKLGKSRPSIANMMRLLRLPDIIQDDLSDERLTMGHARALLALSTDEERLSLRDQIISSGMNVRAVENSVRKKSGKKQARKTGDVFTQKLEIDLERRLGAKVSITPKGKGGVVSIHYADVDELNRIADAIGKAGS